MTKGYVSGKPMIGVSLEDVSNGGEFSFFFGSNPSVKPGVYVKSLVEGMNDKVLKEGDRIVAVNGDEITSVEDVRSIVQSSEIGDKLTVQVSREGKLVSVEVTVFEMTVDENASEEASGKAPEEEQSGLDDSSGFGGLADLFGSFFGGGR